MFATNLKKIMEETGTTAAALAKRGGFSKGAVSAWVNGKYEPSAENVEAIAAILGCSVDDLTGNGSAVRQVTEPVKTDPVATLTCKQVAALLHKHESYVRMGLQQGRPGFEFGSAVKTSGKWSYCIYAKKFTEVTGIPVTGIR